MFSEVVEIRLTGRFAHFRRFYANASPLTYDLPPRTALAGLIGAIMGWNEATCLEKTDPSRCAIAVGIEPTEENQPIQKVMFPVLYRFNFSKEGIPRESSRANYELVYKPQYRVFVSFAKEDIKKDILREFCERCDRRNFVYEPYLGTASFPAIISLANPNAQPTHKLSLLSVSKMPSFPLVTAIPWPEENPPSIDLSKDGLVLSEATFPRVGLTGRKFIYHRVRYNRTGAPLYLKDKGNVVFHQVQKPTDPVLISFL
jgi:CRISPR-associated protein Cas5h